MAEFKDPFSDLSHLEEPSGDELLKKALFKLAEENGWDKPLDAVMTGLVLCVEYQHVGQTTGYEYRTITRKPGGVLPHWHARGLAETLLDYVRDKLPGEQRAYQERADEEE